MKYDFGDYNCNFLNSAQDISIYNDANNGSKI